MEMDYLKIFYELSLAGSVRKLSEIKGVPAGKISRQLISLERELGHTLLERKQGIAGIKLTPQGKILFEALPGILGAFDNVKTMMSSDPNLNQGEITIHTTSSLIEDWIVPMLSSFFETHPSVHLNLISHDNLLSEEAKARLISISPQGEEIENVIQVPLLNFHVGLWASSTYIERFGCPKVQTDLKRHRLLVFAKDFDKMTYPNINWHLKNLDIKREDLICINSSSALIKAARQGVGIISLSSEAIQASGYTLVRILPDLQGPTVTICLTYPSYFKQNKIIKCVEEFFKDNFSRFLKTKQKK